MNFIALLFELLCLRSIAQNVCASKGLADITHLVNSSTSLLWYSSLHSLVQAYYLAVTTQQIWNLNINSSNPNYYILVWNATNTNYQLSSSASPTSTKQSYITLNIPFSISHTGGDSNISYEAQSSTSLTSLNVGFVIVYWKVNNQTVLLGSQDNPSKLASLIWQGANFAQGVPTLSAGALYDGSYCILYTNSLNITQLYVKISSQGAQIFQLINTNSYMCLDITNTMLVAYDSNTMTIFSLVYGTNNYTIIQQMNCTIDFVFVDWIDNTSFAAVTIDNFIYYYESVNSLFQLRGILIGQYQITAFVGLPVGFVAGMQTGNLQTYLCSINVSVFYNCLTDNGTQCTSCPSGYYLSQDLYCVSTQFCQNASSSSCSCTSFNNTKCSICLSGYFLNSSIQCQACANINGCIQCTNSTVCLTCNSSCNITSTFMCQCPSISNNQSTSNNQSSNQSSNNQSSNQSTSNNQFSNNQSSNPSNNTDPVSNKILTNRPTIVYFEQASSVLVIIQLPFFISYFDVQNTTISTIINQSRLLFQNLTFKILNIQVQNGNSVYITFATPLQDLFNALLVINFNNPNHPDTYSFLMSYLVSKATYEGISDYANAVELPILMMLMLYLFVQGYKNTYLIIIFQRLSFLRFPLTTQSLNIFNFLYNLRFSYYSLGTNAIKNALPSRYFEYSDGNFYLIDTDANIARNAGIPIIIWLVTIVMRLCGLILVKYRSINKHRRSYFRCIEFFERTIMFPLIFFAIANMTYCNKYGRIQGSDVNTYNSSIFASILFMLYFLVWSIINVKIKSQLRYDMILDYLFALFESIIIVQSIGTNRIMVLILSIFFRTLIHLGNLIIKRNGYIQIGSQFKEKFKGLKCEDIIKLIILLCQIVLLAYLYFDKFTVSLSLLIILVLLEVVYAFKFLFDKYKGTSKIQYRFIHIDENIHTEAINININNQSKSAVATNIL